MAAITACPSCQRQLKVPENLLGRTVRCPSCKTAFVAQGAEEEPIAMIDEEPQASAPDAEASKTQTAKRRRVRASAAAASAVKGPGIALLVIGILAILWACVNGVYALVFSNAMPPNNPQFGAQAAQPGFIVGYYIGYIGALVGGFLYGGFVIAGAISMLRLRLYPLAMTGSIASLLPCTFCCLLGLPFGIWALVVLNREEVRAAFS